MGLRVFTACDFWCLECGKVWIASRINIMGVSRYRRSPFPDIATTSVRQRTLELELQLQPGLQIVAFLRRETAMGGSWNNWDTLQTTRWMFSHIKKCIRWVPCLKTNSINLLYIVYAWWRSQSPTNNICSLCRMFRFACANVWFW